MNEPLVVAVSGVKNSGKTTLIESVLPLLKDAGLNVAVVKHDGHSFDPDPPGTDTGRFMAAGAAGTAIFDGEKFKVVRRLPVTAEFLIAQFPEADLILLEGFKYTAWPKLEVVRAGNSAGPVCDPASLLALVTDLPLTLPGVPALPLNEPDAVARFLLHLAKEGISHV
nr:molybdopterin-guanine dinucleotide biosynthesis protein B [uncultured Flavonifractor sp.]